MSAQIFDVIVVGAGVEGSASAYHLVKNNQKTLLLEQFPLPHCRGSSHGQTRITRYAYPMDYYTQMMIEAYPMWDTLSKEANVEFFKQCGVLSLGEENGKLINSMTSAMNRHKMDYQTFSPSELRERYPMLNYPAKYGGLLDPKGGILRSDKALAAFQSVFKQHGGVLHDGEPVTAIKPGRPFVTVKTTKGEYRAKNVVVAAGPWTSKVLAPLGVVLPLQPIRITVCYWKENTQETGTHAVGRFPCIIENGGNNVYGLPSDEYPGYVKLCVHDGPKVDPDARDSVNDAYVRERLVKYVNKHLPLLQGSPGIVEACMYTNTPDSDPIIDHLPRHKNIIVAAGFSGHGFKLAPAVGKAVTELVLERPASYQMSHFAVSRFSVPSARL